MTISKKLKQLLSSSHNKNNWNGLIEAYKPWLPVTNKTPIITLKEGATPLIEVKSIANRIGKGVKVYVKYDGLNPTGSFKDRGMTMAISKAKEDGCEAVICASTGNTSASAAAYASKGGMKSFVIIPDGYVAQGKLAQALVYGAEVLAIKGNFDTAFFDSDNDGWLDLYVTNYVKYSIENNPWCGEPVRGERAYCDPDYFEGVEDIFYRNDGQGTFSDWSARSGINKARGKGLGVVPGDIDNDGDMEFM